MLPPSDNRMQAPPDPNAQAPISTNTAAPPDEQARLSQRKLLTPLSMTAEEMTELWAAINRARERVKKQEIAWDILLKEYIPIVRASGTDETLKVNVHFRNVHTKIGQLFNSTPEVQCIPKGPARDTVKDPLTGVPQTADKIVALKQAVLNWQLGPDGVNGSRLMDECLFDVLAWSGFGATKIGYRATMKSIEQPVMIPDPSYVPPPSPVLGLSPVAPPPMVQAKNPDGSPQTQTIQVPIHEEWYWRRFSPKKALWNDDLRSSRYDDEATWMGWEFAIPKAVAKREFALSDAEVGRIASEDDRVYKHEDAQGQSSKHLVKGVELWRKAALFRHAEQPHPQAMDHVVVIDGLTEYPVVYRPSPDQDFDERGRLTENSLIGFPIHIITIRDLADSPFTPSDSAFTNTQAKELNTTRRQGVARRDAAVGKLLYDAAHFEDSEKDQYQNGPVAEMIAVKPGALRGGPDQIIARAAQVESTGDDWRIAEMIKQDMDETLGISSNQAATPVETVRSATELAQMSQAFASRNSKEQNRAVGCFISGARKLDALLMRYATETQFVAVAGDDGTRDLKAWNNKVISGRYSYDILPDSSWRMDTAQYLRMLLSLYNLAARDPLFNRAPVLRQIAQLLGQDPRLVVWTPEQIAQMQAQPQHSGKAQPISQHEQRATGNRENSPQAGNQPARMMA